MNIFDILFTMNKELISEIVSNVTDKILSAMFSKSAGEKAFMLECDISYRANWYFDSDYMSIAGNALQKVIQIVLRKRKNCVLSNI